jgi:glutathione S-transferase
MMDLYFLPLACSMATRIALYEAGAPARFLEVDHDTKRVSDGSELRAVNPLELVPVLRTEAGDVLTENAVILSYVARQFPDAKLGPRDEPGLTALQRWLGFIATELHQGLFSLLLDRKAPAEVKRYVLEKKRSRLDVVAAHLQDREYLLGERSGATGSGADRFSVADAYLVTVLNWMRATPLRIEDWPSLASYVARHGVRPSVARAMQEELALFVAAQANRPAP